MTSYQCIAIFSLYDGDAKTIRILFKLLKLIPIIMCDFYGYTLALPRMIGNSLALFCRQTIHKCLRYSA